MSTTIIEGQVNENKRLTEEEYALVRARWEAGEFDVCWSCRYDDHSLCFNGSSIQGWAEDGGIIFLSKPCACPPGHGKVVPIATPVRRHVEP